MHGTNRQSKCANFFSSASRWLSINNKRKNDSVAANAVLRCKIGKSNSATLQQHERPMTNETINKAKILICQARKHMVERVHHTTPITHKHTGGPREWHPKNQLNIQCYYFKSIFVLFLHSETIQWRTKKNSWTLDKRDRERRKQEWINAFDCESIHFVLFCLFQPFRHSFAMFRTDISIESTHLPFARLSERERERTRY